ncbi:unnamed protein product [Fusarium venenatum]|uniref:Uncharacterized protein n=1 Tax=Fusarium venenatum TaxID=56646 RepID=A0A2L2TYQ2_9HYPO|nr:uncharacterized protein FVRRES_03862 [Fusarium venenatum]CEI67350.1 unnamed protein product [Fusarium venenatum]
MAFQNLPTEILLAIGHHADDMSLRSLWPRKWLIRKLHYAPRDPWGRSACEVMLLKQRHPGPVQYPTPFSLYKRFSYDTSQALKCLRLFPCLKKFQFDLGGWDLNQWRADSLTVNQEFCRDYEEDWLNFINDSFQALGELDTDAFT